MTPSQRIAAQRAENCNVAIEPEPTEAPLAGAWWENPPQTIEAGVNILERRQFLLRSASREGIELRKLVKWLKEQHTNIHNNLQKEWPIAFFKASYEQSLLINSWIWGYQFPVCFSANRIGKTAGLIVNALLWLIPNDPTWKIFQPYVDHLGREVEILPRPLLSSMIERQAFLRQHPDLQGNPQESHRENLNVEKFNALQNHPGLPQSAAQEAWPASPSGEHSEIWLGAPDAAYHRNIIIPEWRAWCPRDFFRNFNKADLTFEVQTPNSQTKVICKSYEQEDTKWSGDAVEGIILTEGVNKRVLKEIKQRFKEHAFASWDYTPYEAINSGEKANVAHGVMKDPTSLPLKAFVFTGFSVRKSPTHIIGENKRRDLIRMWENTDEGEARLEGRFYSSSPLLLSHLEKPFHWIDWSFQELQERIPDLRLFRGIDVGFDHPTCCAWGALSPQNIWFIYRFYSKRQRTIDERCEDIITMSNNKRVKAPLDPKFATLQPHSKDALTFWQEVHHTPESEIFNATVADWKLWKVDETTGNSMSVNYTLAGLPITESVRMSPKDRVVQANQALQKNPFLAHPLTGTPSGARVFFLGNEVGVADALAKMEELYWDRLQAGPNKGEPKETPQSTNDDELDALCYLLCSPFKWSSWKPRPRFPTEIELEPQWGVATTRHGHERII